MRPHPPSSATVPPVVPVFCIEDEHDGWCAISYEKLSPDELVLVALSGTHVHEPQSTSVRCTQRNYVLYPVTLHGGMFCWWRGWAVVNLDYPGARLYVPDLVAALEHANAVDRGLAPPVTTITKRTTAL